ncbi:hypothetical protein H2198_010495 [Neophaeococcomyces mojaviensis]|uniref:Uncharacterized protein n=1 Tax=Neophaeococcomyces mojaviensis TaxID=3383035 RepID=A0ACC2ZRI8_9EURO|nr:hypothetical protein H2198_010495 [Knufia sp. JES_112]
MPKYDDGSESPLPQTSCLITTHDGSGKAIFYERPSKSDDVCLKRMGPAAFNVLYATSSVPVNFTKDKDLNEFIDNKNVMPIFIPGGTLVRMVDLGPGECSPIHRTKSLDYGVVLNGEIELILEDLETGPVKLMKAGDVSVQRATLHAWRNHSKTEWARMLYVLQESTAPEANGQPLEEDHGGIELPAQ